jgi:hypothetical protein
MSARRQEAITAWPVSPTEIGVAYVGTTKCGGRPTAIVMLPYSRALWAEPMNALTAEAVVRVLVHAVRYFRGAPRAWRLEDPHRALAHWDGMGWYLAPSLVTFAWDCSRDIAVSEKRFAVTSEAFHVLRMGWLAHCPPPGAIKNHHQPPSELRAFFDRAAERPHPFIPHRTVAQMMIIERAFLLPETGMELDQLLDELPEGEDDATSRA